MSPSHPTLDGAGTRTRERPPYGAALLAGLAVFLLYTLTLARTTQYWDASEYIATGHILGIPHPPGNPLFVLLARTWDILLTPLGLSTAVRINLFSAAMGAGAHGLWFLVVHRVLRAFDEGRSFRLVGAAAAVAVSATAFTVWNQSNVNEKVYTVSLFTIALLTWLIFQWREHLGEGKDDNLLVLVVFILGLSVANHLMAFLATPALLVYVAVVHPRSLINWRLYVAGLIALGAGLSVHLFLPIRAGLGPIINEASPTCGSVGGALVSVLSWGQAGCAELSAALSRQQYDKPPLFPRLAPIHSQIANYLQYFDWQWARSLGATDVVFSSLRLPVTLLFTALGVIGGTEHLRRDRRSGLYFLVLLGTLSLGLVIYLNFRYGFSIAAPVNDPELHEVRERDYFFIVSFSLWGLWSGVGIATLWRWAGARTGRALLGAPVLALALVPLLLNFGWASRSRDYSARDWAYNLLQSVEPYGVLFTNGDNDTFPLWYLQEVEGIRRDVTVIVTSYLNTDWYVRQLKALTEPCAAPEAWADDPTLITCQRSYQPAEGGPRYVGSSDPLYAQAVAAAPTDAGEGTLLPLDRPLVLPQRAITSVPDTTLTRVANTIIPIREDTRYRVGPIDAVLPGGQYLQPWHQFAISIIAESMGERPIYFASSGSGAPSALGLDRFLMRQGLAYKLLPAVPSPDSMPPGVIQLDESPLTPVIGYWLDVERTRRLVEHVFVHRGGIPDAWDAWPDRPSIGIPNYYSWTYYSLAQAAAQRRDAEAMERYRERAEAWGDLGS
ncbi:MAG: DUF2723 domain-containing protein [Gemmatimonadota bacterium]